jgi:hypothetical protein
VAGGLNPTQRQGEGNRCGGVQRGGVEHGHARFGIAQQQAQLGAAQDRALRAGADAVGDQGQQVFPGLGAELAGAKLFVDHPMQFGTLRRVGHQAAHAVPALHVFAEERLLHGEGGAEQQHRIQSLCADRLAGGVDDVDQRQRRSGRHGVGHDVHGVGADQDALGAAGLQAPRGLGQQCAGAVPFTLALAGGDHREVQAVQQQSRRMQRPEAITHAAVDQAVVLDGRFPAHAADEADGAHACFLRVGGHAVWTRGCIGLNGAAVLRHALSRAPSFRPSPLPDGRGGGAWHAAGIGLGTSQRAPLAHEPVCLPCLNSRAPAV